MTWTETGGGDHEGESWYITSNATLRGIHTNVKDFKIDSGITVTVLAMTEGETEPDPFTIQADVIEVVGDITGIVGHWGGDDDPYHPNGYGTGGGGGDETDDGGGGGGGYGGAGGAAGGTGSGTGGAAYGNANSVGVRYGSGGGMSDNVVGGNAGAAVLLIADIIDISGIISLNGSSVGAPSDNGSGGGSGGGCCIIGNDVTISGTINCNGGAGANSTSGDGGGGGGGRIKIHYSASYDSAGSTITVAAGGAGGGSGGAGSAGTSTSQKIGLCTSASAFGWKQTFNTGYKTAVSEITVYVETVNTAGDFTLTVYDDEAKGTTYESDTITISGTGENVFLLDNYQVLEDATSYYFEIVPDSTGDIELGVDIDYDNVLNEFSWFEQIEVVGMQPYLKLDGFSHMIDIDILNTADTDKVLRAAAALLNGTIEVIKNDATGTYNYTDDFSTEKYLADCNSEASTTYQEGTDDIDIADNGYMYWVFDTLYSITGTPVLTANIDITAGSPTIQIANDDGNGAPDTWYDIDTAIVDGVSTEYDLVSTLDGSVAFDGENRIWVRVDCQAAGITVTATITSIEIDANLLTLDADFPSVNTGGANTFQIDHAGVGDIAGSVSLVYPDRRYA